MRLVEIMLGDGALLLGHPAAFPHELLLVEDKAGVAGALHQVVQQGNALRQLRERWGALFPGEPIARCADPAMRRRLTDALAFGRLRAVFLRRSRRAFDASLPPPKRVAGAVAHIETGGATVLVAPKGRMPPQFRAASDNKAAADLIGTLSRRASPATSAMLRPQIARVLPAALAKRTQATHDLVLRVRDNRVDATVLRDPLAIARARRLPDAPKLVARMTRIEKVQAAGIRAYPYVSRDVQATLARLKDPKLAALLVGFTVALAGAQLIPGVDIAVDLGMLGLLLYTVGRKGPAGLNGLIRGATAAVAAQNDADLDRAARIFAAAFEDLGEAGLAALFGWLQSTRIAGRLAEEAGATTQRAAATAARREAAGTAASPAKGAAPSSAQAKPALAPSSKPPVDLKDKLKAILDAKKGTRPPPHEYLSEEYITGHLAEFKDAPIYKIIKGPPRPGTFGDDSVFVLPKSEVDAAIAKARGDPREIEKLLGMDPGYLGDTPYLLEFKNPKNLRMASGNEANAWDGLWEPGGYTKGGIKEAVIDGKIDPGDFVATPIGKGN